MSYETIFVFDQNDVGMAGSAFEQEGTTFTHSAETGANTVIIEDQDSDGMLDDQLDGWGQTCDNDEGLVSFNGDTDFAGADFSSFATYNVTGSDGSEFKAYIIGCQDGRSAAALDGGDYTDNMYIGYSEPLQDGVTYTYSDYCYVGQVDYDELATQETMCFVKGTLIKTLMGEVAIEHLKPGDRVYTLDHGLRPIRWIGHNTVSAQGHLAPVAFQAGVIGNHRELLVSPAHRVLVKHWKAELLFGKPEVLVSAISMVNGTSIKQIKSPSVDYFHMLFDTHEIVFSEGATTESLHPGAACLDTMAADTRSELLEIFPDIPKFGRAARDQLNGAEASVLFAN